MEPFSILLKIDYRPLLDRLLRIKIYFDVPPAAPPLEPGGEPGMAPVPDEPVPPAAPLELGDEPAVPEVPVEPEVGAPASPPSRWPQPEITMTLKNASAIIDLEVLDIVFIFIPFRDI
jgi:hypothetical protein